MRVLITGGAGFLGSAFVRLAARERPEWEITVLDRLTYAGDLRRLRSIPFHFVHGDILDQSLAVGLMVDHEVVVHFAAETHVDRSIVKPKDFIRTNVLGTQTLLEAARLAREGQGLFVHISTDEVYGPVESGSAIETWPLLPSSPYSASKVGAEAFVRAYQRTYGFSAITVRPCNALGPFQHPEKFIPRMTVRAILGKPLLVYGTGKQRREWLWADDIARAILLILEKGAPGEVYNIGSGHEEENISVAGRILEILGANPDLIQHVDDRPGHDIRYFMDSSKIMALGWKPSLTFNQALSETVSWFAENRWWWEAWAEEI
ncbi:MAG: dTDP-glucose 4,6-dehydratase [candidate division WOR-3 bacterium]